ncbi:MAG: tRNA uridine-5-carboxymethylaminomethyl(34) synthesis enzyme MnmG [Nitrospirae bacterium]|nr:tRNA uridine-5-carboxymethylaminomethyl(34) synthesis enzyme MnmG [Nitrospirota bacterium]
MYTESEYDIIVVGGGHAGCEAALACARMGLWTCLFAMNLDTIAQMSCNPAIGGLAKGHLVREIDALGGEMARVADRAGIQFRILNRSKGPAVWSLRAQADRVLYRLTMRDVLESEPKLTIKQASVERILTRDGRVTGVSTSHGASYGARAVVITTGTFLKGLIHIGLDSHAAGRAGEFPSLGLSDSLRDLGLKLGRLKTGTPPRIDARSIDFSMTTEQRGDDPPVPFSYSTEAITNPQLPCFITHTNEETHRIILDNLDRSPLYSGRIKGTGPRYCPSIEDKVVRFSERPAHQVFLEPEGLQTKEYYANGISTSLPYDVQVRLVRSIAGLEEAEIMRPGYAIEYDFVYPTQLRHTLETKSTEGLFLAGQINGTSGYEEAAAQGLMAGINAALKLKSKAPLVLQRHEAYIGVLIDDLVTKGTSEPYRMFTSRAEYRLLLRHDNADFRLSEKGFSIGLLDEERYGRFLRRKELLETELKRIGSLKVRAEEANPLLEALNTAAIAEKTPLLQLLKRPEVSYDFIRRLSPPPYEVDGELEKLIETEIKYKGYIKRQMEMVERMKRIEGRTIPPDFRFDRISGLSTEVLKKLEEVRPANVGEASRIPGVTPAAIALVMIALEKNRREKSRQ